MITWKQYLDNIFKEESYEYSSLMINIKNPLSHKIKIWGDENIKDEYLYNDPEDPSFGREEDPHITILYGIESSNIKQIKNFLKHIKPFELKLGKISLFTNDKFNVIKIDVIGEEIFKLNQKAKFEFNYKDLYKKYIPHVTIAYTKKTFGKNLENNDFFENEKIIVKSIVFSNKNGHKINIKLNT